MVLCVVPLYAHRIYGKHLSHCAPGLCVSFFSSCFRVELNCSTIPPLYGWYGEVLICLTPVISQYLCMVFEIKFDPLSVSNSAGIPVLAVISIRQFTTVSVVTFLKAKASGHLVW